MPTYIKHKAKCGIDLLSIILSVLSDTEKLIVNCTIMRLKETEALEYLKENGHEMSRMTYYRIKAKLEDKKLQRLYEIAKIGFVDEHLERIDQFELILQEMWKNYEREQSPLKRVVILEKIAAVQPYLSVYYKAIKMRAMKEGRIVTLKNDNSNYGDDNNGSSSSSDNQLIIRNS
jgi:hypothetical protein